MTRAAAGSRRGDPNVAGGDDALGQADGLELVDTHCHLDAPQFAGEATAGILARAAAAGVRRVVTVGTNIESSRRAVALARAHDGLYATVGIDPNEAADFKPGSEDLDELQELAQEPEVVAIGEIGIDNHWDRVPWPQQVVTFEAQLELAGHLGLPVVIHNRDADAETASILGAWAAGRPLGDRRPLGVLHCFSGDTHMAEGMVDVGFLVSLAGNVTFRKAHRLHAVAQGLPTDALVLETDSPYLAPHPRRGTRNEPGNVRAVAAFVAELRGSSLAALAAATTANAGRLFRWSGGAA